MESKQTHRTQLLQTRISHFIDEVELRTEVINNSEELLIRNQSGYQVRWKRGLRDGHVTPLVVMFQVSFGRFWSVWIQVCWAGLVQTCTTRGGAAWFQYCWNCTTGSTGGTAGAVVLGLLMVLGWYSGQVFVLSGLNPWFWPLHFSSTLHFLSHNHS